MLTYAECSVCLMHFDEYGRDPDVSRWRCGCLQHASCIAKLKRAARSAKASTERGSARIMHEFVDQYCPICRQMPIHCKGKIYGSI